MRYFGQNYEIEVPVGFDEVTEENLERLFDWFHQQHEHFYGDQPLRRRANRTLTGQYK